MFTNQLIQMDTLYKRTKTGSVQSYAIQVTEDAVTGVPTIVKETGQLTGKKTYHKEAVPTGKNIGRANETSPFEQAKLQAEADWKKKQDEGYKTAASLGWDERTDLTLEAWLDATLPKFNSDASGNWKPMLAKTVDWKKVTYPCLVQPKLDGVRCLMVVTADYIQLLSRNGKEYATMHHIEAEVLAAVEKNPELLPFTLDGELYSDELSFQEIVSAVKALKPTSSKVRFRAYDMISVVSQQARWNGTVALVDRIASPFVQVVPTFMLHDQDSIKAEHDNWVQQGYEGAMIRLVNGSYDSGQRSSSLLKVKEFDTTEFAFKNFEFGQRGVEDLIAVCWTAEDKEFRAKMQGTKAEKELLYKQNDLEGNSLTVKHFGYTEDKLPRFPIGVAFRNYE